MKLAPTKLTLFAKGMIQLRRACESSLYALKSNHCNIIKLGTIGDTYIANILLTCYVKNRQLQLAHKLFDEMPQRDTVSWNSLIAGYVNHGVLEST
ncbi:putative tetratricopeptide-like helical domain superfamily [Helianthus annuus]|nr:putative tetratricopeptide-like helical domain superfamily [Helianthus annuus]